MEGRERQPVKEVAEPGESRTELVHRVMSATMRARYYHWDWGEAIAMDGLLAIGSVLEDSRSTEFVVGMIDSWIEHTPDPWYPDHVGPGRALLDAWQTTGDRRLIAYARLLATHLLSLPRSHRGCFFSRPDLPDRARMVWVDSLYTDPGFLCLLGQLTGEAKYVDAGVDHLLGHLAVLQDESGLVSHAYNDDTGRATGIHWARGNGWAALGLLWCLETLPRQHAVFAELLIRFRRLIDAILDRRLPDQPVWSTVLDDPGTYQESSAALMFSAALIRASHHGFVEDSAGDVGRLVWRHYANQVDHVGVVVGVSGRTPPREESAPYNLVPTGCYVWGQGAYLLAAVASYL